MEELLSILVTERERRDTFHLLKDLWVEEKRKYFPDQKKVDLILKLTAAFYVDES
jgi:hypothetical protein